MESLQLLRGILRFGFALCLVLSTIVLCGQEIEWRSHSIDRPLRPAEGNRSVALAPEGPLPDEMWSAGGLGMCLPAPGLGFGKVQILSHREIGMEGYLESRYQGSTMFMRVDRIENNRRAASGTLRLELWATPEKPEFGQGYWGWMLGSYVVGSIPARSFVSNVNSGNVAFRRPGDGVFHMTLVLTENVSGEWYYVDMYTFTNRDSFGARSCPATSSSHCLNASRFHVWVTWKDFAGNTGTGQAMPITGDTGYFWFFSSNNVELVIKLLDGRPVNGRWWVFYGALSNVEYTITVTDTQTGATKRYLNRSGQFASVGDTLAFQDTAAPPQPQPGTGDLAFRLTWSGCSDLDLYVQEPNGTLISFQNKSSPSGGQLDVDSNAICASCAGSPVENIFWPTGRAPRGSYSFWVEHFPCSSPRPITAFTLQVLRGSTVAATYTGSLASGQRGTTYRFTF